MNFVERNAKRGFGQPVITGRGLTVFSVVSFAYYKDDMNFFLNEFDLSKEEMKSAILYCKNRQCKLIDSPSDRYCVGCILRSISEGWKSIQDDFIESDGISISKNNGTVYLGTKEELEDDEFGVMGWVLAEAVEKKWLL
ncbi:DUF433 domain-containing protein [Chitinophaga silvisoli]|uniref:DUF433 domain-containing protein n=1 Tax=Chitinophaga silvisoli TaxID=2291814 RepID=A0A3E1NMY4_9BACT|nr:DUF433 domain-containing protein [Chitinophaga silvisoli]RFM29263.1 DUF433 domain-containing protein [Chitinophaga silvisoli]